MSIKLRFNLSLIIVTLLLMGGCSSVARIPATVTTKEMPPSGNRFDSVTYYTVVKGDTLASIGRRYDCSYQDIAQWNGLSPPYTIHPGQQLRVLPTVSSAAVSLSNEQDKKLKAIDYVETKIPPSSNNGFDTVTYYTVVEGDTLASIGRRYGYSYQNIIQWNGLSPPYTIHPGQQLRVLPTVSSATVDSSKDDFYLKDKVERKTEETRAKGILEISLKEQNSIYMLPVKINGAVTLDFVLDTGASEVVIPLDVILTLIRTGTIAEGDLLKPSKALLADGSTVEHLRVLLRELEVGGHRINNVECAITRVEGEPLLGQSFLRRLGSYSLDNDRHVLVLKQQEKFDSKKSDFTGYYDVVGVANDDVLNVRVFPGESNKIVATIPYNGKCVTYLNKHHFHKPSKTGKSSLWMMVRHQTSEGWVHSSFLTKSNNHCSDNNDKDKNF